MEIFHNFIAKLNEWEFCFFCHKNFHFQKTKFENFFLIQLNFSIEFHIISPQHYQYSKLQNHYNAKLDSPKSFFFFSYRYM